MTRMQEGEWIQQKWGLQKKQGPEGLSPQGLQWKLYIEDENKFVHVPEIHEGRWWHCSRKGQEFPTPPPHSTILWFIAADCTASSSSCGLWLIENNWVGRDLKISSDLENFQRSWLCRTPCSPFSFSPLPPSPLPLPPHPQCQPRPQGISVPHMGASITKKAWWVPVRSITF